MTSTLQQASGRQLGFSASRTMRLAQGLYEGGFITYMRTDSTTLSKAALKASASAPMLFTATIAALVRSASAFSQSSSATRRASRPAESSDASKPRRAVAPWR